MSGLLRSNATRGRNLGLCLGAVVLCLLALSGKAWASGEYEPNDSRETAAGPLAGGSWYTATFETENDVDWYVFYVKTYSQMDFSAGMVKSTESYDRAYFYLYDKDGKSVNSLSSGHVNELNHLYLTLNPGRYYFRVEGETGDVYKFRIDPAASITTSKECGEAIVAKDSVGPLLDTVNGEIAKNAEKLASRVAVVHEAKKVLHQDSAKAKRLRVKVNRLRRLQRSRWHSRRTAIKLQRASAALRQVRSEVRSAAAEVNHAIEERQPYYEEKVKLEAIAGQHKQEISDAEGQIAAHC